jgi:chemosensory pili system protein ChpA (sensor histidine kinase/response regulator)
VDGDFLPLLPLERFIGGEAPASAEGAAVVLRLGEQQAALRVDRVLGQDEIVVKSLGGLLAGHPLFAGATIGGDGEVNLILDVPGLLNAASHGDRGRAAAQPTGAAGRDGPSRPKSAGGQRRRRVLFVDDSLSVRRVAENFLRTAGFDVVVAVDGRDGQEKLRNGPYDLVFTDLEMPRMNGYEFIREIRRLPAYQDLPVVVVTSRSGDKHREQAAWAGATDYVTKPFTQDILCDKIQLWAGAKKEPVS